MLKPFLFTAIAAAFLLASPSFQNESSAQTDNKETNVALTTEATSRTQRTEILFISRSSPNLFLMDTPMEFVYKEKLGSQTNLFQRYAQFFLITKAKGNQELVENILENESDFLKYYEAILRGLNYYFGENKTLALDMFERVYDKTHSRLLNSFEGMMLQDILLRERAFDKADLVSDEYCFVLLRLTDRKACLANAALLAGVRKEEKYTQLLLELEKFGDNKIIEYIENQLKEIK